MWQAQKTCYVNKQNIVWKTTFHISSPTPSSILSYGSQAAVSLADPRPSLQTVSPVPRSMRLSEVCVSALCRHGFRFSSCNSGSVVSLSLCSIYSLFLVYFTSSRSWTGPLQVSDFRLLDVSSVLFCMRVASLLRTSAEVWGYRNYGGT
jgi:hypothetical protein